MIDETLLENLDAEHGVTAELLELVVGGLVLLPGGIALVSGLSFAQLAVLLVEPVLDDVCSLQYTIL